MQRLRFFVLLLAIFCSVNLLIARDLPVQLASAARVPSAVRGNQPSQLPYKIRYTSTLAFSPNYATDHAIFAGVWNEGVYVSTDAGAHWRQEIQGLTAGYDYGFGAQTLRTHAIAVSPSFASDRTVFIGTQGAGIFRSTDAGANWQEKEYNGTGPTYELAVSPNFSHDHTLFAFGNLRSTDGGETWHPVTMPCTASALAFSINYRSDRIVFGGGGCLDYSLFRSTDGGSTWTVKNTGLENTAVRDLAVSPDFGHDRTIFAVTTSGLYVSTNQGDSWVLCDPDLPSVESVALSPAFATDGTMFVAGAYGVFRSSDRGNTFRAANVGLLDLGIKALAVSPAFASDRTLLAGTFTGLFRSVDGGDHWQRIGQDIPESDIQEIVRDPAMLSTLPVIAVDLQGYAHIAYMGTYARSDAPDGVTTDIFYTNNRSGAFSSPTKIEVSGGYYSKQLDIAIDRDGWAHIVFLRGQKQTTSYFGDFVAYATNRGGVFAPAMHIVADPYLDFQGHPVIGTDSTGTAHIAFQVEGYPREIRYTHNAGGAFADSEVVGSGIFPDMAVDGTGHVYITYSYFAQEEGDVYYVTNASGAFSAPTNASRTGDLSLDSKLALDASGSPHVIWDRTFECIAYTHEVGGSFADPICVGYGHHNAALAVSPTGAAHVAIFATCFLEHTSNERDSWRSPVYVANTGLLATNYECIHAGRRWMAIGSDGWIHLTFYSYPFGNIYYMAVPPGVMDPFSTFLPVIER